MVKLANEQFNNDKIIEFINILKTYKKNITVKDIELFIKIDKTVDLVYLLQNKKRQ